MHQDDPSRAAPGEPAIRAAPRTKANPSPAAAPGRALRVAVLVDLEWTPAAGGHVKFWERAAAGAAGVPGLDLTVYYTAAEDDVHRVAENVRYRLLRPVFSTRRLPFLAHVPDHTDLAPRHGRLARELRDYDVVHTTDAYFAFARTALREARRGRFALVNSVHTDTPGYTRLYTAETVRRIFGGGAISRLLLGRLQVDRRAERRKFRQLRTHQAESRFVFGPREQDIARARDVLPPDRVLPLPRGLELDRFNPRWRDRTWLATAHGIAPDAPVVLCVGRVNVGKNVMVLAEAVRSLAAEGRNLVAVFAGEGEDRARITALLGAHARCPGPVLGDDLARLYASADLLAHPSQIESFGNTVSEGMAAGLPVLVAADGESRTQIENGTTGFAVGAAPADWAAAIRALLDDPARRGAIGMAARAAMEARFTDWRRVVAEKFLPVWRKAAGWSA
jgi:glycosyltransferase involved in cell wall biosynthesis